MSESSHVERQKARAELPPETVAWLLSELEMDALVEAVAMPGGSTSAMHRVTLRSRAGTTHTVVVRRYVIDKILTDDPGVARSEAAALQLVAPLALPTPRLMAADLDARTTDAPTIVMSWLDGRPNWRPSARSGIERLAEAMVVLHHVDPAAPGARPIERRIPAVLEPPRWTTHPEIWERAFAIFHGPVPDDDTTFVHRDLHLGNVLWRSREISGVVDWQSAGTGPSSIDVSHCRLNFLYDEPFLADQLRATWERVSGKRFDPWADVMSIVGALDSFRTRRQMSRTTAALEDALDRAVAALGQG